MKIILTGADGQLGYELKKQVKNYDYELISFSKIDLDITNIGTIRKCVDNHRPDIIINSAAYTNVDKAETDIFSCRSSELFGAKKFSYNM